MIRTGLLIASFCFVSVSFAATDTPRRKSGLWETSVATAGAPTAMTAQMCVDEKSDDLTRSAAMDKGQVVCSKNEFRREGGRLVTDSVCKSGNMTVTTRGVFTGDLTTNYTGELKSSFDPPVAGRLESTTVIKGRWLGPCKPDMKPGDMILPGGMKFNLNDQKAALKK